MKAADGTGSGERTDIGRRIAGVANLQRLKSRDEFTLEFVRNLLVQDESLGGDAGLAMSAGAKLGHSAPRERRSAAE